MLTFWIRESMPRDTRLDEVIAQSILARYLCEDCPNGVFKCLLQILTDCQSILVCLVVKQVREFHSIIQVNCYDVSVTIEGKSIEPE